MARRFLVVATALVVAAGTLVAASPAVAAPIGPDEEEFRTYVTCKGRPSTARFVTVVAVGPGRVLIAGDVRPCRRPRRTDDFAIGEFPSQSGDNRVGLVPYRSRVGNDFVRVASLSPGARKVCLHTAPYPYRAHDCWGVTVPERPDGRPGVPKVGGRVPIGDARLPAHEPNCGSCW
jgi:hypothetical protein